MGRILLQQKAITQAELDTQLEKARRSGVPLATQLTQSGTITEVAALKALSEQKGVPGIDLNQICIRLADLDCLPREIAIRHKLLPILAREDRLFCAMAQPTDKKVIDELEFVTGKRVFAYIALEGPLMRVINSAYDQRDRGDSHYIGPQCPEEVQRKAGVVSVRPPEKPAAPVREPEPVVEVRSSLPKPAAPEPAPFEDLGSFENVLETVTTSHDPRADPPSVRAPTARGAAPEEPAAPTGAAPSGAAEPPPRVSAKPKLDVSRRPIPRHEPESVPPGPRPGGDDTVAKVRGVTGAAPRSIPRPADSTEQQFRPSTAAMRAVNPRSQVVVDDHMQKVTDEADFSDLDFESADRDLSVVSTLPVEPPAPMSAKVEDGARTILVVDDEDDIRKLLRRIFEEHGYRVREADRGLLALQMVKHDPPDLMILDAMLPEVHGFDIARRIRGSERYGHIPIVMVSAVYRGWRFAEDAKVSYGVDAYLEKPFKVADIVAAVESALLAPSQRGDPESISKEAERLLAEGIKAYKAGDLDLATERLEAGTQLDPLAYRLHFHLGLLYGKKGQLYDAIQELETALQINGAHFAAIKNLAVLYQKAGFRNKAIEAWERALAAAPDEPTRQTIREHLLSLL